MTTDFNFYLNTQGLRGRKGEKGSDGFAPVIEVNENTLNTFTLKITTADGSFITSNLRGSIISNAGSGTVLGYDRLTDTIYLTDFPTANTTQFGAVRLATETESNFGDGDGVMTASDVGDYVAGNLFSYLLQGSGIALSHDGETGLITVSISPTYLPSKLSGTSGISVLGDTTTGDCVIGIMGTYLPSKINAGTGISLTKNTSTGEVTISSNVEAMSNYNTLINKPTINGVTLQGNLTSEDLNITATADYVDLTNKPTINGVTIVGDLTSSDLNISAGIEVYYEDISE